jgi:PAT family beta-lactamase induction signal transducer AmpG
MDEPELPPLWVLALVYTLIGTSGAVALITVPQLLEARGVPEPTIANVTAIALIPSFAAFLVSPILDVRFSRRTWAIALALLTATASYVALMSLGNLALLEAALFVTVLTAQLYVAAVGGWIGSLVGRDADTGLGAWFGAASIGGFGVAAIVGITLIRALPGGLGAALLCLALLLPLTVGLWLPAPPPDGRLARESFAQFFADIGQLVRRPSVVGTLILFAPPAASFALTNQLGGVGHQFGASEQFVGVIAGVGVTLAGIGGSLIMPPIARRMPLRWLYLAVGTAGAGFTLTLLLLPRTPLVFAIALIGENIAQSAAFAVQYAIILREMGKDNPLAATQFAVLQAATALPITYMQWIDGRAYAAGGVNASFVADAGLGLAACAGLALFLRLRRPNPTA